MRRLGLLDRWTLEKVLEAALSQGAEFAEVYVEDSAQSTLILDDGRLEKAMTGREAGVGIRVARGDAEFFVTSDDVRPEALLEAASTAARAAAGPGVSRCARLDRNRLEPAARVEQPPLDCPRDRKAEVLRRVDRAARASDPRVKQVLVVYRDTSSRLLVANSEGLWSEEDRVYVRMAVHVVAARNGEVQTGTATWGKLQGFESLERAGPETLGGEAARQALVNLEAAPAPSGPMPVVVAGGWGGVMFHEACGHGLEADAVLKKASVYAGRLGQQVASPLVTAIDDPTIPGEWGSYAMDDEGAPARPTVLIEKGVLRGYMFNRRTARLLGHPWAANGRRQSYHYLPLPRMSNTFIAPGDSDPEEIVADTRNGFFARDLRGGQVNPATGDFVFHVSEGYMIRNGRIAEPVRGAALVGNGPEVLRRIDRVGKDLSFASGLCGKDGQSVPASCGQPTLRVSELIVGGTEQGGGRA
ncbi:MAG: TldD/PmbA family protein [Acetobacteraceae bacterium]|nr:TldD/PmbA family protein [Acetobacteraceae bacterium]